MKIARRAKGWGYAAVCLGSFLMTLVFGLLKVGAPAGLADSVTAQGTALAWIYDYLITPCNATMFSLLAFYIASASYRAFRVRSREATALLAAALVVLLGRTPFGLALTSWLPDSLGFLRLENLSVWIIKVPNTAGQRAIMIGIALGVITMSLRLILGLERGLLGRGEERG